MSVLFLQPPTALARSGVIAQGWYHDEENPP